MLIIILIGLVNAEVGDATGSGSTDIPFYNTTLAVTELYNNTFELEPFTCNIACSTNCSQWAYEIRSLCKDCSPCDWCGNELYNNPFYCEQNKRRSMENIAQYLKSTPAFTDYSVYMQESEPLGNITTIEIQRNKSTAIYRAIQRFSCDCLNGGTCMATSPEDNICNCGNKYSGERCQTPIQCTYTEWTQCSKPCDGGVTTRKITNEEKCSSESRSSMACNTHPCRIIDASYGFDTVEACADFVRVTWKGSYDMVETNASCTASCEIEETQSDGFSQLYPLGGQFSGDTRYFKPSNSTEALLTVTCPSPPSRWPVNTTTSSIFIYGILTAGVFGILIVTILTVMLCI